MSIQTTRLEKEYEIVRAHSTSILDAEKDRVRRMEYLLLQFERDALRSQLDQANEQLLGATESERVARTQLEEAFQEIDRLDAHVQSSSSEMNRLRVGFDSAHPLERANYLIDKTGRALSYERHIYQLQQSPRG